MEIDQTINKWFNHTHDLLPSKKENDTTVIDNVIFASIPIVDNYIQCALKIANEGKKLPAMAFIRITSELIAKIIWCMSEENGQEMDLRIKQWDKSSLMMQRKLMERLANTKKPEIRKFYEEQTQHLEKLSNTISNVDPMPNTTKLFGDIFNEELYATVHTQFNRAIHIDTFVLSESKNGNVFIGDISGNAENIKGCLLSNLYIFFKHIYDYYQMDSSELKKDFDKIVSCFKK